MIKGVPSNNNFTVAYTEDQNKQTEAVSVNYLLQR